MFPPPQKSSGKPDGASRLVLHFVSWTLRARGQRFCTLFDPFIAPA
jgi:hypothetical protein